MALTYAQQRRVASAALTSTSFEVETTVTDAGDLPDRGAFVFEVIDPDDATLDSFVRVAEVGDIATWGTDRPTAIGAGDAFYRAPTLLVRYPTIEEAQAAANFLVDRLNALVDAYQSYGAEFFADPEIFELPQNDLAQLQNLVDAYTAKVAERTAQTALVADKEVECSETSAELAAARSTYGELHSALSTLYTTQTALETTQATLTTTGTAITSMINAVDSAVVTWFNEEAGVRAAGATSEADALDVHLDSVSGVLPVTRHGVLATAQALVSMRSTALASELVGIQSAVTSMEIAVDQLREDIDTLDAAAQACATDLQKLKNVQEALAREEQDLLDQIRVLCPSYTP